jgi:hypothetical protein
MKSLQTANRYLSAAIALGVIAMVLFVAAGFAGPAFSTGIHSALLAQGGTPTPPAGEVIPLKPVTGLTSLNATVKIDVNGKMNGKIKQGSLTGVLTTNDQGKSQATVSGSLLGDIAAQVGGSLVSMFTPSKVDVFKVPEGTYVSVGGLIPMCVKPDALNATAAVDDLSPQGLLAMLTGSDVARGQLIGQETRNGVAVQHYVINGDAFLAAAQNSSDPKLKEFSQNLWSAKDADLYVDAAGGYPVSFSGSYSGALEPLKFEGDFTVQLDVTGVNTNTPVNLPAACSNK